MKTRNILIGLIISILGFNIQAQENLLTNGDFEIFENLTQVKNEGWWDATTNNVLETNAEAIINGNKSMRFSNASGGSWLSRNINVEAGAKYIFSFTGRIHDGWGVSGSPTTNIGTLYGRVQPNLTGDWTVLMTTQSNTDTTMTVSYTIPDGVTQLKVQVWKDKSVAFIDDLSFTKDNATKLSLATVNALKAYSPYAGAIRIAANDAISNYAVFSVDGKLIKRAQTNANEITIDANEKGIYILRATVNGSPYTQKVLVK